MQAHQTAGPFNSFRLAFRKKLMGKLCRLQVPCLVFKVDTDFVFGQVLNMSDRCFDGVVLAQIFADRLCFRGGFDDHKRFAHFFLQFMGIVRPTC